jgi:hypothetical protein
MSTGTATPSFKTRANNGDGGDFELPPSGTHPAVMVGLIDLGTTENTYNGKTSDRHKILLVWELTAEADSKGQNFIVAQDYTWSLNKKAALRPIVEGFRGKALADDEEYDLALMLGKPCMINVTEGVSGGGKKFAEIAGCSPPMRGLTVPPATRDVVFFHIGALTSTKDDLEIPDWVPPLYGRKVVDDIKKSKEYAALSPF